MATVVCGSNSIQNGAAPSLREGKLPPINGQPRLCWAGTPIAWAISGLKLVVLVACLAEPISAWSQLKDFGNREEGTADRNFTEADVELVSFMRSPLTYPTSPAKDLELSFFGSSSKLVIVAQELMPKKFYAMRSKPGKWTAGAWNRFGPWSTGDVLLKLGISSGNVGVVAWLDEDAREVALVREIAPVFVGGGPPAASGDTRYRAILRPSAQVDKVEVFVLRSQSGKSAKLHSDVFRGPIEKDTPLSVEWSVGKEVGDGESLQILVQPSLSAFAPPPRAYRFVHKTGGGR